MVVILLLPLLFPGEPPPQVGANLPPPWRTQLLANGDLQVFGLTPGVSRLEDAVSLLGTQPEVALIAAPGEDASLEAFFSSVAPGGVKGKMVLALATTAQQREAMLSQAVDAEYMKSSTRRIVLDDAHRLAAQQALIDAIAFIAAANLDEETIVQRFGPPAERLRSSESTEHFLYPERGLELRLDAGGKEVLQYVAPRQFQRLRDPLVMKSSSLD